MPYRIVACEAADVELCFFSGPASDMGRLKNRCSGWLQAAAATVVFSSSLLICLVASVQIEKIRQFSGVPPHSQRLKKQSSNSGPPSTASNSSSRLIWANSVVTSVRGGFTWTSSKPTIYNC